MVSREIHADFAHHLDRVRVDLGGLAPSALDCNPPSEELSRKPLGHLAARGVRDAEKE
jgi:hypothetical protein